jgi:DNA-binding NtrC family response regulator
VKERVLFVDDDRLMLDSLRDVFRGQRGTWSMQFATSAQEACTLIQAAQPNVLVTDLCMAGFDGVGLLRWVTLRFPEIWRVALSGTDRHIIAPARHSRFCDRLVCKPCPLEELREAIRPSVRTLASNRPRNSMRAPYRRSIPADARRATHSERQNELARVSVTKAEPSVFEAATRTTWPPRQSWPRSFDGDAG